MELEKELKKRGMPNLKLVQSVCTRWNSTFYMLESLHKNAEAIVVVLINIENSLEQLTLKERCYIPIILKILQPFVEVTSKLGGETYSTVSLIIPSVKNIMVELDVISGEVMQYPELLKFVCDLQSLTKENLLAYEERRNIVGYATILDPRFKEYGFVNRNNYRRVVSELQKELKAEVILSNAGSTLNNEGKEIHIFGKLIIIQITSVANTQRGAKPMFSFLKEVPKSTENIHPYSQAIVHLNNYLTQSICDSDVNIIDFWNKYTCCEELKALALRYLIVPATSVPSERTNSTAGNIITQKRSRLYPAFAQKLLFLKENFYYFKLQ